MLQNVEAFLSAPTSVTVMPTSGLFSANSVVSFTLGSFSNPSTVQPVTSVGIAVGGQTALSILASGTGTFSEIVNCSIGAMQPSVSLNSVVAGDINVIMRVQFTPAIAPTAGCRIVVTLAGIAVTFADNSPATFSSPSGATGLASIVAASRVVTVTVTGGLFTAGSPIDFSIGGVTNPASPAASKSTLQAAVIRSNEDIQSRSSTGTFPEIVNGHLGADKPTITLNSIVAGDPHVTMTVTFTPASIVVPPNGKIIISLTGAGLALSGSSALAFTSPSGAAGIASMASQVLTVTLTAGTFNSGVSIDFTITEVINPTSPQSDSSSVVAVVEDGAGKRIGRSTEGKYPAIVNGHLGANKPAITLNSIVAGDAYHVTMSVSFTPASIVVPPSGKIIISLVGAGLNLSTGSVLSFSSPANAAGAASMASQVLTVSLTSGTFNAGGSIVFAITNAINPSASQAAISSIVAIVEDHIGLRIGRSTEGTYPAIVNGHLGASAPLISLSSTIAGDPFVTMFVVLTPSDIDIPALSSIAITLAGDGITCADCIVSPRDVLFVSPSGAQGTARLANLVLTVLLTTGNFPAGNPISFAIAGVRNPTLPQPSRSNIRAAVTASSGLRICKSAVGTFPAIFAGDMNSASAPAITLSNIIAGASGVTMTVTLTPVSFDVPVDGCIIVTLFGEGISLSAGASVVFVSHAGATGSASMSSYNVLAHVLNVCLTAGTSFSAGSTIVFTIPSVSNPKFVQLPQSTINIAVTDASGAPVIRGRSLLATYPAIVNGSLGYPPPSLTLSSVMALANDINVRISFIPKSTIPSNGKVIVTISGASGIAVPSGTLVLFSEPDPGASGSISNVDNVLTLTLTSGVFPPGALVSFSFGSFKNPIINLQPIVNVVVAVTDASGVLRGLATDGYFPAITSDTPTSGMPVLSLSDNSRGATSVRMSVSISPVVPLQSDKPGTLIITVAGVLLSCSSTYGCRFASSSETPSSAMVTLVSSSAAASVFRVQFAGSISASGPHFTFFIDDITNPDIIQPNSSNVRAAFVDSLGQVRSMFVDGSFPAIVSAPSQPSSSLP